MWLLQESRCLFEMAPFIHLHYTIHRMFQSSFRTARHAIPHNINSWSHWTSLEGNDRMPSTHSQQRKYFVGNRYQMGSYQTISIASNSCGIMREYANICQRSFALIKNHWGLRAKQNGFMFTIPAWPVHKIAGCSKNLFVSESWCKDYPHSEITTHRPDLVNKHNHQYVFFPLHRPKSSSQKISWELQSAGAPAK